MPPTIVPTLPTSTHVASPWNHVVPSTTMRVSTGFSRRCRAPVQTYAARPTRSLRSRSASRIINASNPTPAITRNRSPLIRPTSRTRWCPLRPTRTAPSTSLGIAEVGGEEVRRAGGDDRHRRAGAGQHVGAALHHPVAAPHEHQVGPGLEGGADLFRCLFALRHLVPQGVVDRRGRARTSRSSVSPPPSCLRVWATTATVVMPTPPAGARHAVAPARRRIAWRR